VLQFGKIVVEHVPQTRHIEFETPHPTKMLLRPVIAVGKDAAVPGKKFDKLMLDTFEIDPGRIPAAAFILALTIWARTLSCYCH